MSRRKREIQDGKIRCSSCEEWKFLDQFYVQNPGKLFWTDPVTGKKFGTPKSECRYCTKFGPPGARRIIEEQVELASAQLQEDEALLESDDSELEAGDLERKYFVLLEMAQAAGASESYIKDLKRKHQMYKVQGAVDDGVEVAEIYANDPGFFEDPEWDRKNMRETFKDE